MMKASILSSILLDGGAGYNIYTTRITYPTDIFNALSPSAKALIRLGMPDPNASGYISASDLVPDKWDEDHRILFHTMSVNEQIDICAFVTSIIHEFLHHMDLLRTPFGASLHEKLCREFLAFEHYVPILLRAPVSLFNEPLADWSQSVSAGAKTALQLQQGTELEKALVSLRGTIAFDEVRRGTMPRHVDEGWNGNTNLVSLANGRRYEKVTINQLWASIRIKNGSRYLSPNEIIEGRTLALCIIYLFHLLGENDSAIDVVKRYIEHFYQGQPTYLSLIEIHSGQDVSTLFDEDINIIKRRLWETAANGWYSLQSPVSSEERDVLQSMTARCVQIARVMRDTNLHTFSKISKFLLAVDNHYSSALNASSIEDSLFHSAERLSQTLSMCRSSCKDTELRNWYLNILEVIRDELIARISSRYELGTGLPPDGNPIRWIDDGAVDLQDAPERVHEWYELRQLLVTKRGRTNEKIRRLSDFFAAQNN